MQEDMTPTEKAAIIAFIASVREDEWTTTAGQVQRFIGPDRISEERIPLIDFCRILAEQGLLGSVADWTALPGWNGDRTLALVEHAQQQPNALNRIREARDHDPPLENADAVMVFVVGAGGIDVHQNGRDLRTAQALRLLSHSQIGEHLNIPESVAASITWLRSREEEDPRKALALHALLGPRVEGEAFGPFVLGPDVYGGRWLYSCRFSDACS
jgi:hypothetical protein